MGMHIRASYHHRPNACVPPTLPSTALSLYSSSPSPFILSSSSRINLQRLSPGSSSFRSRITRTKHGIVASSNVSAPLWDSWKPDSTTPASTPSFSDIFWPSAGAFAAMAIFGKMDQILAPKGISMTIAPLGAVSAVLFVTPSSPGARKYNMFMAQIGCAAIGVIAFSLFGPGWLARSAALSASIAFMIYTRSTHPPARDCVLFEGQPQVLSSVYTTSVKFEVTGDLYQQNQFLKREQYSTGSSNLAVID
ncbi:hypothetical protein SADUNF_Sadunf15G0058500 [Salix dunnii]|uniref:HPP transmembrane region domain-containing protein n=1 Tax=Salix dunnii TaxID=1413687 RepID=A0A835MJ46_9ROSI|nr:hypothetical protein SADUNF_Sadunf15G0058500 [Salix dunnii]